MRSWSYFLFKSEEDGLSKAKSYWNFIESSTKMTVKFFFGILKRMRKILLNVIDKLLRHVLNMVSTCICFHNLCIIHCNKFDDERAKMEKQIMRKKI